jgi:CRISPR-associated protein Csx1
MNGMPKNYIIQVLGRLSGYRDLNIIVSNRMVRARLVSEAIRRSIEGDWEILLYIPESLVTYVANDPHEAASYIENPRSLEEVFREKIRESGLLEGDFSVKIVRSAGLYVGEGRDYRIQFVNDLDSIITYLFLDLLELGEADIIADISTGQNFYVVALLEALRHLLVYRKLEHILDGHRLSFKISTITPPATARDEGPPEPQPVDFSEIDVKVFFEYPFRSTPRGAGKIVSLGDYVSKNLNEDIRNGIIRELVERFSEPFEKLKDLLNTCRIAFNALKHNAPLCFYHREIINLNDLSVDEALNLLKSILNHIESRKRVSIEKDERLVKVERIMVSRFNVVNTFLAIALFKSLQEKLGGLSAIRSPTLSEIEESFKRIYNALGLQLNTVFLSKEISDLRRAAEYLCDGEELLYAEVLSRLGNKPGRPQDPKRNFFAHAGLTYDETLVRRDDGEVRVRYQEDCYGKIKGYLEAPL